ncbi:uncharacterized protein LOC139919798 [Centroberyx gerrardi]
MGQGAIWLTADNNTVLGFPMQELSADVQHRPVRCPSPVRCIDACDLEYLDRKPPNNGCQEGKSNVGDLVTSLTQKAFFKKALKAVLSENNMEQIEERLAEEVRKHVYLYDPLAPNYKDHQLSVRTWREISKTIGLDTAECLRKWKNLRDKFVRVRKKLQQEKRSGDGVVKRIPAFYHLLSWLSPHIKHRDTDSNCDDKETSPTFVGGAGAAQDLWERQKPIRPGPASGQEPTSAQQVNSEVDSPFTSSGVCEVWNGEVEQIEERLAEEVRKHVHLYDPTAPDYKDHQLSVRTWREISKTIGLDTAECLRKWKNLRDKFVRVRKKLQQEKRSGDGAGKRKPTSYNFLSWLSPYIKHRDTDSNCDDKETSPTFVGGAGAAQDLWERQEPIRPKAPASGQESTSAQQGNSEVDSPFTSDGVCEVWNGEVEQIEERLAEEVRKHVHLYDPTAPDYKDHQLSVRTWREISKTIGLDTAECLRKWKNLRDKFVRVRKKLQQEKRSGDGAVKRIPAFYHFLSWLSPYIKHRETDSNCDDKEVNSEVDSPFTSSGVCEVWNGDLQLPLSSLRLLVPPVRLMSACMWQVAQQRNVEQYGKLSEFITLVTEMVPELMSPKQKTQLILGLRARLILELLQRVGPFDCEAIQDHLNSFQLWTTNHMHEEVQDGEVEISKTKFVELVRKLVNDQTEKEKFFKEVFPVQYGACFDTMLQILLWEFFFRLEEFLPVPSFSQVASGFDLAHLDPQFEQFVCDPEDLRMLLQHRKHRQRFTKSEFSFMSDTILSTLASKQTSVYNACEDDEVTDDSSNETAPSNSRLQEDGPSEAGRADDSDHSEDNTKIHSCHRCGKRFWRETALKHHLNTVHSKKELYSCDQCKKCFTTKHRLEQHLYVHTGGKPYKCSHCGQGFSYLSVLKSHSRRHTGERPYACTLCDKRFNQRYTLTLHVRHHKGEKPYLCSECGKTFCGSGALLIHSRLHTGEKPYHCKVCGKNFITLQRLKVHQLYHTDERPHPCSECGKRFRSSSALKRHIRCHTGERPFKCIMCDKRFSLASNMRIHLRSHNAR